MERQLLNFNIEWLEALWSVLALISAALFRLPVETRGCGSVFTGSADSHIGVAS
jgi:hypothetical protein